MYLAYSNAQFEYAKYISVIEEKIIKLAKEKNGKCVQIVNGKKWLNCESKK